MVVHYALTYGRQVGKYTIPAVLLGDIIAVNFSLYMLASLLKLFPSLFSILKIMGGLYMIIMLCSLLHLISKLLFFLLAFLLQFLNPNGNIFSQTLLMGGSFIILGLTGSSFYTLAAGKIHRLVNTPRAQKNSPPYLWIYSLHHWCKYNSSLGILAA